MSSKLKNRGKEKKGKCEPKKKREEESKGDLSSTQICQLYFNRENCSTQGMIVPVSVPVPLEDPHTRTLHLLWLTFLSLPFSSSSFLIVSFLGQGLDIKSDLQNTLIPTMMCLYEIRTKIPNEIN